MSGKSREAVDDLHRLASEALRRLNTDEKRQMLRDAGVLGITPHLGDKVRVVDRAGAWRYAIVVGVDPRGNIGVVHLGPDGTVAVATLAAFAGGQAVQMVQRPREGTEQQVATRALRAVGQRADLSAWDVERASATDAGSALLGLLVGVGLAAAVVAILGDDRTWDESAARYRDARGRFAPGRG